MTAYGNAKWRLRGHERDTNYPKRSPPHRPTTAPRARPLQVNVIGSTNAYETYDYEVGMYAENWSLYYWGGPYVYEAYVLYKSGEYLMGSSESLDATLSVTTQGIQGKKVVGEPGTPNATTVSRTIANH